MTPQFLSKFSNSDVEQVFIYGNLVPNVDMYGNLNLISNSSVPSASIIGFPLEKKLYDKDYINNYYNPQFTEFTATPSYVSSDTSSNQVVALQTQLQQTQTQLDLTQTQLDTVISQSSNMGELQAEQSASMALAISLRIQLGEGSAASDFSSVYPWLPLTSTTSSNAS